MPQKPKERRKRPRVAVKGEVLGRIHTLSSAPVLDISEDGALLEVSTVLRPGSLYTLRLALGPERLLSLKTRVVRTYVHAFHPKRGGESVVTYRAALEFLEVSEQDRAVLRQHLEDVQGALDLEFE
jgi:hypothetical protein